MNMTWICKIRDSFVIILHYGWWCVCLKCDICIEQVCFDVCIQVRCEWMLDECFHQWWPSMHNFLQVYKIHTVCTYFKKIYLMGVTPQLSHLSLLFMPQPIFTNWSLFSIEFSHHSKGRETHSLDCPSQDYPFHKSWVLAATPFYCCKLHFTSANTPDHCHFGAGTRISNKVHEKTMYYIMLLFFGYHECQHSSTEHSSRSQPAFTLSLSLNIAWCQNLKWWLQAFWEHLWHSCPLRLQSWW